MNGIDKILSRIAADADTECEAILAEAQAKCDALRGEYRQAAKDEYGRLFTSGAKEAQLRAEQLAKVAALEAKKQVLATKQELVSLAFGRAAELLLDLPEQHYVSFLAHLAAQSSRTGCETLIFSDADRARVGKKVTDEANRLLKEAGRAHDLQLGTRDAAIRGGFILSGGDVDVNCGFEVMLESRRNELIPEVAGILFD